jgi:hypothetical protein
MIVPKRNGDYGRNVWSSDRSMPPPLPIVIPEFYPVKCRYPD